MYSGHEYALQNLAYGEHVEPENQYIKDKIQWCRAQRESVPPIPTVPSTIAEEKLINPFMRVNLHLINIEGETIMLEIQLSYMICMPNRIKNTTGLLSDNDRQ